MPAPRNLDLDASSVARLAARPDSSGAPGRNPDGPGACADGSSWPEVIERL
jgi:hypothetical protein